MVAPGSSNSLKTLAIEVEGLQKIYTGKRSQTPTHALKDFSISITQGEIFGLLGPNGAGKSTFINILAGLVVKTSGSVWICGFDIDKDPRHARQSIGVVPQELTLDPFFTPRESLDLQAGLYGVRKKQRKTEFLLDALHLTEVAEGYARRMSGGMKRRLMLGKAMVHSPPVLVLDEPTAGVDVELRKHLWQMIHELNRNGTTIVLTTHYLEEAEKLCDRIAIIDKGQVVACDATSRLVALIDRKELIVSLADDIEVVPEPLIPFGAKLRDRRTLHLSYQRSKVDMARILDAIQSTHLVIQDLSTEESDLEDVFVALTQKK